MRPIHALAAALALGCGPSTSGAPPMADPTAGEEQPAASPAPRPEDVPVVGEVTVGLAGGATPDVVRYLMVRRAWAPRLSPDGRRVAFRSAITGNPQLWVGDAGGGWPRQLTFGQSVTFHAWSPTGDWIAYGTDRGGNEREGFYLIRPDGLEERELLAPSEAFRSFGGFSRDGARIAYATTSGGGATFDVHVMELASGEDRRVYEGRLGFYVAAWRPDGGALVVGETRGEDANDLHLLDLTSGTLRTLFAPEDDPSSYRSIDWLPDGSAFFMVSDQGRDFTGVARVDATSGALTWVHTPERDVEQVRVSHDGRLLAWTENDGGFSALHVRPLVGGGELALPEGLPRGILGVSFADDADVMAIEVESPRVPGDIWVWDLAAGRLARATESTLAGIDPATLVEPAPVDFPGRDGETLHGLLYLPARASSAPPPVLLGVHGGPTAQSRPEFDALAQYLLARGIAVFELNFRGSTGYGKRYARLDNGRLRPNAVNDMADALDWLGRDGRVDATRAAVMGGSYGGYMTFAALVSFPERFRGGVSFVGVSNWVTALEEASPELRASDRLEYGDIEDPDDRAFFASISPIHQVDRIRAPLLVSHGANDPRDPPTESDRFVVAARERVEVEYLRFADEGHGVRHLRNRVHLYQRVAAFLERVLR